MNSIIATPNSEKVLNEFLTFDETTSEGLPLRELGRRVGLSPTGVKKHLEELRKKGIIIIKSNIENGYPLYLPNTNSSHYVYLKGMRILESFRSLGIIDYLEKTVQPEIIVLSGIRLEKEAKDFKEIKIYLLSEKKEITLKEYEEELNIRITPIFVEEPIEKTEHYEEIINGIVLKGRLQDKEKQKELLKEVIKEEDVDLRLINRQQPYYQEEQTIPFYYTRTFTNIIEI